MRMRVTRVPGSRPISRRRVKATPVAGKVLMVAEAPTGSWARLATGAVLMRKVGAGDGRGAVGRAAGSGAQAERLNQDLGGGIVAQGEATTVDHADKGAAAADFGDEGAFAKAHLTNTLAKGGFTLQRTHAAGRAGG